MINSGDAFLARLDATRVLALGGIILIVVGMFVGEIYAIYISHVANGVIKQNWAALPEAVSLGDTELVHTLFAVIEDLAEKRGRTMNTHSHIGAFGLLAIALAFMQSLLSLTDQRKRQLAWLFLGGAVLQIGGVYLSYYVGAWVLNLSDLGALMVVVAVGWTVAGLVANRPAMSTGLSDLVRSQLQPEASRFLLRAGLLLILFGMVFGLFYAWQLLSEDQPALHTAINAAIDRAGQHDVDAARDLIAQFKGLQSKIAITAAAHSHAIEFGLLMVLLAFVQRFVLFGERWRLRWARVLTTGAYLLPVCVYLATLYGLRAAAFADISGGLVVVGLLAMAVGIVRYTGVVDTSNEGAD